MMDVAMKQAELGLWREGCVVRRVLGVSSMSSCHHVWMNQETPKGAASITTEHTDFHLLSPIEHARLRRLTHHSPMYILTVSSVLTVASHVGEDAAAVKRH